MIESTVRGLVWLVAACLLAPLCAASAPSERNAQVIVVRRGWHIDVGFATQDLESSLSSIASDLPLAHFVFFGFGDLHYLMSQHHTPSNLSAALWPGGGIMLVTGLRNTPQRGFGAEHVLTLDLNVDESRALQRFIWNSFAKNQASSAPIYREGPYEGSLYFMSVQRYSALHTCNTWAAQALKAGGLPVRSRGVWFAGQLWGQVRRLAALAPSTPSLAPIAQASH